MSMVRGSECTDRPVEYKAHLRTHGAHLILERPCPSDLDAQGNVIPMNAQQRRVFKDDLAKYDRPVNIAFSDLISSRQNPKVNYLPKTGMFNTAFKLLQRLCQRYYTVDDITQAAYLVHYHAL